MRTIAVDFEVYYSSKLRYTLKNQIVDQFVKSHLFDPYLISVSDGLQTWSGEIKNFNWQALDGACLVSHNARFDETVYLEMVERGLAPKLNIPNWFCSADLTSYICNRRALDHACEHLLKVKLSKGDRKNADGRHWPADFSSAEQASMIEYARKDAHYAWLLWDKFSDKWPERERRLSMLTRLQGRRGVQLDTELLEKYLVQSHEMKCNTEKLLPWLDDSGDDDWSDFNAKPTSTKCIAEACRRSGIPCPPIKVHDGEEAFLEWEATYIKLHPWVSALTSWRSINKLYKTFATVKERLRDDGTLPFALKYFGAHCFTGEHEVLTPEGWRRLDEWRGGSIMQWTGENLCFGGAVLNEFDVSNGERLLQLQTGQINCVVTQGHWMATFDCKTGEQRKEQAEYIRTRRRKIPISGIYLDGFVDLPVWKIQLFAAVQADGHYMKDCRSIRFRLSKLRKIERLREILSDSALDWKEDVYPSEPTVTVIVIRQFPEWLENRKQWTSELLTWTQQGLKTLCNELVHWDGTSSGSNSVCYTSTDPVNVSWISTIAHLVGKAASITKKDRSSEGWSDSYNVFIRDANKTEVRAKNWSDEGPARKVFCPTAEYGACLFRHKGTIFITHQTGRWSGDAKVNMQNMRKKPVLCNEFGLLETDEKRQPGDWIKYSIDFRALVIPRPGKKMIVSDLSQIEPRVLAWLSGDTAFLDLVRTGMSPYEAHARSSMAWTGGNLKKENQTLYNLAKARVLALGYGCGWEKFILMAQELAGLDITAEDPEFIEDESWDLVSGYGTTSKKIVADYRAQNPKVAGKAGIWAKLDEAFKRSIGSHFHMGLPSGRRMTYEEVRCEARLVKDPKTGKLKRKTVFTAGIGGRRVESYGGKLTENLVQAVARDVFAEHLLKMEDNGWTNLFSSHDEAVIELDNSVEARDVEQVMSSCPEWLKGCPVAAVAEAVERYKK